MLLIQEPGSWSTHSARPDTGRPAWRDAACGRGRPTGTAATGPVLTLAPRGQELRELAGGA